MKEEIKNFIKFMTGWIKYIFIFAASVILIVTTSIITYRLIGNEGKGNFILTAVQ